MSNAPLKKHHPNNRSTSEQKRRYFTSPRQEIEDIVNGDPMK